MPNLTTLRIAEEERLQGSQWDRGGALGGRGTRRHRPPECARALSAIRLVAISWLANRKARHDADSSACAAGAAPSGRTRRAFARPVQFHGAGPQGRADVLFLLRSRRAGNRQRARASHARPPPSLGLGGGGAVQEAALHLVRGLRGGLAGLSRAARTLGH